MHCRRIRQQFLLGMLLAASLATQSITGATKVTARPVIARAASGLKMLASAVHPKKLLATVANNKLKTAFLGTTCYAIWDLLPVAKAWYNYKKEKHAVRKPLKRKLNDAQSNANSWTNVHNLFMQGDHLLCDTPKFCALCSVITAGKNINMETMQSLQNLDDVLFQKKHMLDIAESTFSWQIRKPPFPGVTETWNAYTDYAKAQTNSRIMQWWHDKAKQEAFEKISKRPKVQQTTP